MQKVWLDTDIGSDIDDALALAYLLTNPACELVGISTVTEVENQRAKLCSALCRVANKPIPIFPGISDPLIAAPRQTQVPQATALAKWAHIDQFPRGEAIFAMRAAIRKHPGEITLLAIGPLTNLAVLFSMDRELPAMLKEIVLMCGAFERRGTEWNAMLDPEATQIVFSTRPPKFTAYGLDATMQVQMPVTEAQSRLEMTAIGRCVREMSDAWKADTITFHDPLAAVGIFHPNLVTMRKGNVDVELGSPRLRGMTYFEAHEQGAHLVAQTVNVDEFFQVYFGSLRDFTISG